MPPAQSSSESTSKSLSDAIGAARGSFGSCTQCNRRYVIAT